MDDYIKREDAINAIGEAVADGLPNGWYTPLVGLPSADVEPVVRCKDCEHRVEWCGSYGCDEWFCFGDEFTDGTMFCGKGERKDDDIC